MRGKPTPDLNQGRARRSRLMPANRRGDPAAVRRALIEGRTDRSLLAAEARRVCRSDAVLPAGNQSRVQRQAADADSIVVKDHDRTTDKVVLDCREVGEEQVCELGSPTLALPAQQQHRRRRRVRSSEEFTEVGIARHEDPARPDCEHHDFLVPGGRKGSVALLDWIEKQTRSRIALSHVIAVRSTSNAAAIRCWGAVSVPSS